jgi:hypothetical protein
VGIPTVVLINIGVRAGCPAPYWSRSVGIDLAGAAVLALTVIIRVQFRYPQLAHEP